MKTVINYIIRIFLFFTVLSLMQGCLNKSSSSTTSSPPYSGSSSDNGKLTDTNAQDAIDKFASRNGNGRIVIKGGVREVPAQNAAVVEINVDEFIDNKNRQFRGKPATATFSHYTDGRWALTEIYIRLPESYGYVSWKPTIDVQ